MQTITLGAPANPLSLQVSPGYVGVYDPSSGKTHGWAHRCFGGNAARLWLCSESYQDGSGRWWETTYFSVPDDFGNLIEVPH